MRSWIEFEQMTADFRREWLKEVGENVRLETAVFDQTVDMLGYHNRLTDLPFLLKTARHHLEKDPQKNEWRFQTTTALLTDTLIFQYLADSPDKEHPKLEDLIGSLGKFMAIDTAGLRRYLDHLSGYTHYKWTIDHLRDHPPQNMAALMIEFLAFAFREAGAPYGRTNLVRHLLPTYLVQRRTGQLNSRQDLGDLLRQGRPPAKPALQFHPLAPDSETLQNFLGKLLNYDPIRPYAAAALFCLMPAWLTFLQKRGLLKANDAGAAHTELKKIQPDLQAYFATFQADPSLATAIFQWSTG